jgi:hypothetical protein
MEGTYFDGLDYLTKSLSNIYFIKTWKNQIRILTDKLQKNAENSSSELANINMDYARKELA